MMSPELVQRLGVEVHGGVAAVGPQLHPGFERSQTDALQRERAQRFLLAIADCAAALLALVVVANLLGDDATKLPSLGVIPLVLLLHKLVGLYDRDHVVIRRS